MQFIRDYMVELRRSPVKSSAIALLLAVGLLLWGRLLLKEVPRTASAWEQLTAQIDSGSNPITRGAGGTIELAEPGPMTRDLFQLDPSRYRRTRSDDGGSGGAKFGGPDAENDIRTAVLSAAGGLRLTSVIEGEAPLVIINNRLLRRGDTIEGFTVIRLERRSVILERQGIKVRVGL